MVTLQLKFRAAGDKTVSQSYNYADEYVTSANVTALANAIVANGEIFAEPPLEKLTAQLTQHEVTPIEFV
jgi:hypothetical protein